MGVMCASSETESRYVRVTFKPKNVKPIYATELREVVFTVEGKSPDEQTLFDKARAEAIEQNVISKHTVRNHWEPYKHEVVE